MTTFLKNIIVNALIIIVLFFLTIFLFSQFGGRSPNSSEIKIEKYINSFKEYDICFYGDSKQYTNFDYSSLNKHFKSKIYNFSLWGTNLTDIQNLYGDNFCNCDVNFINIDIKTLRGELISNRFQFILSNEITPFRFYFEKIFQKNPVYKSKFNNGFMTLFDHSNRYEENSLTKELKYNESFIKDSEEILKKLKVQIKNKNVIFIFHPDRKERMDNINNLYGENILKTLYVKFFEEYDLIDLSTEKHLQKDSLYFDNLHLNENGSKELTKVFIKEFESLN